VALRVFDRGVEELPKLLAGVRREGVEFAIPAHDVEAASVVNYAISAESGPVRRDVPKLLASLEVERNQVRGMLAAKDREEVLAIGGQFVGRLLSALLPEQLAGVSGEGEQPAFAGGVSDNYDAGGFDRLAVIARSRLDLPKKRAGRRGGGSQGGGQENGG
jgi:hypothetical protein